MAAVDHFLGDVHEDRLVEDFEDSECGDIAMAEHEARLRRRYQPNI